MVQKEKTNHDDDANDHNYGDDDGDGDDNGDYDAIFAQAQVPGGQVCGGHSASAVQG